MENKVVVEVKDKIALTVEEAAAYSNIGPNKISSMLKNPR